jgi:predicted  nucleic acid-binding Zn-ribbon protein
VTGELGTLWALHELDERLVRIHDALKRHPEERKAFEGAVTGEQARLAAHQQRLTDLRTARRRVEHDIEALTGEEKKFQSQLPLIKKNEEYQALLHEISDRRLRRSDLETDVLMKMDAEQELVSGQPVIEKALAEARAVADARVQAIAGDEQRERDEAAVLEGRRAELLPQLPQAMRLRYERIRESRGGRAVVPILKGACGGCYRGLPPQALQEARKGDRVLVCDGCGRLLILPPGAA